MTCQSLWHTPEAFILTRTSPALGGSSSQSTTCSGSLGLNRTAAFIAFPPACAVTIASALLDPASQARSTRAKETLAGGDEHERTQSSGGSAWRRRPVGACIRRACGTGRHRPGQALSPARRSTPRASRRPTSNTSRTTSRSSRRRPASRSISTCRPSRSTTSAPTSNCRPRARRSTWSTSPSSIPAAGSAPAGSPTSTPSPRTPSTRRPTGRRRISSAARSRRCRTPRARPSASPGKPAP